MRNLYPARTHHLDVDACLRHSRRAGWISSGSRIRDASRRVTAGPISQTRILLETIASTSESRAMLATMNRSPYSLCSDAEIEYFRQLIFQSQFLKAAGRIRGGRIDCSTTSGRTPVQV